MYKWDHEGMLVSLGERNTHTHTHTHTQLVITEAAASSQRLSSVSPAAQETTRRMRTRAGSDKKSGHTVRDDRETYTVAAFVIVPRQFHSFECLLSVLAPAVAIGVRVQLSISFDLRANAQILWSVVCRGRCRLRIAALLVAKDFCRRRRRRRRLRRGWW